MNRDHKLVMFGDGNAWISVLLRSLVGFLLKTELKLIVLVQCSLHNEITVA